MKVKLQSIVAAILFSVVSGFGQGTFIYDQQSSDEGNVLGEGAIGLGQQPLGQSFAPSLNSVGFIRIDLLGGTSSGSFHINLRSDSITGTILGTTASVAWSGPGFVDFPFSTPISVNPGTTYYFQPVIESGTGWALNGGSYNYAGGNAYVNGSPVNISDLWFREGVVAVPEPSSIALLLSFGGLGLYVRKKFQSKS